MSKVTATYDGFVGHNGVPVQLHSGDEYDAAHSLVQDRPELFTEPAPEPVKSAPAPTPEKPAAKPAVAKATTPKPGAKDG
jgi:hypothetical protein